MKIDRQSSASSLGQRPLRLREMSASVGYLKLGDLVAPSDIKTSQLVRRLSKTLRFASGQRLYPTEETERSMMIIEGTANIFATYKGERTFVKRLERGSIVGDIAFLGLRMLDAQA